MPTFLGEALYFVSTDDQSTTTYIGMRDISFTIPGNTIELGDTDSDIVVRDLLLDAEVNFDDTGYRFFFQEQEDGSTLDGIYFEISGSREGQDNDGLFNDEPDINYTYRIFREGVPLPELTEGQTAEALFADLGITEANLDDAPGFPDFNQGARTDLRDIEGFRLEGDTSLTVEEAQEVALLYEAAFGRQADADGLNFWIDQREAGLSPVDLSTQFIDSIEFAERFGEPDSLSNGDFIDRLYANILDRDGEAEGADFWTTVLDENALERPEVLLQFAVSDENVANAEGLDTLTEVSDGEWAFA
ncbi:MAG: DUF4214 domain-containing protein [Pseudomonadota bacterium]